MRTSVLCGLLLLLLTVQDAGTTVREYYIAAVEFNWDYLNSDLLSELGARYSFVSPSRTSTHYRKTVYVEFKDSKFLTPETKPKWMGILGPTIRAEVNDKVIIHFKNLASRPYSIHPYGISYWKMSEGASYNDHTSASEKEDDVVKPKGEYVYVWEITDNLGPLDGDSRCLTSAYSSHVDQVRDFNSGLIGAILICKHGTLNSLGKQVNQQEFVLLFSVIDESKSWYLETDRIKYKIPGPRKSKRLMYSINGYINSSLPDLNLCKNRDVSWHLIAMGSVPNLFSIYFSGNGLLLRGHRVVSIELAPTAFTTAEMSPSSKSKWLLSCQNPEHQQAGMTAYVTEEGICEEDSSHAPWQTLTWVETEEDEEDNDKDNFNIQMKYMMRTMSTKQRPIEWIHYITAEECDWDYAPSPPAPGSSQKLERNPNRIGKEYKKAVYVEYTDNTFTIVKYKPNPKSSKGILGPVLRGEVGDRFKIVFKNLASRPYNLNPHGLTKIKVETAGDHHVMNHSVQPNEVVTYFWNVTESDGPTQSDPGCQTHFYFSSVDVVRDMASGLIGPMLICRKEMLNMNARPIKIDRSKYLLLSLFDENKSWYINENIQKYCEEPSSVNTKDPEFYQSNLMYSINGFVNESAPNLDFCLKEDIFWHVIVGAQNDILSLYFHGQTFKRDGIYEDVLTLFPFSGETIRMDMDNIGQWLLKPLNYQYQSRGMRAKFTVRNCDNEEENYENLVNFINTEEEDLAYGNVLEDEMMNLFLRPRGFRKASQLDLNETINIEELLNSTDDEAIIPGEEDPIWLLCGARQHPPLAEQLSVEDQENHPLNHLAHESSERNKRQVIADDSTVTLDKEATEDAIGSGKTHSNSSFPVGAAVGGHKDQNVSQSVQANHSSNNASQSNRMKGITSSNQLQSNLSITGENAKQTHLLLENQILKQEDIVLTDGVKSNHSIKWPDKTTTKTRLPKVLTFEQISNNKTEGTKLRYNETNLGLKETQSATPNWTSSEEHLATGPRNSSQDSKESDYFDYEEYEKEGSGDINETDYGGIGGTNFRTFADLDWCPEDWPSLIPRSSGSHLRHFFIAAIETIWDYKGSQTAQASKLRVQQLRGQRLGNKFKKVVFQQYMDNTFRQPVIRGEFEEHLGILGPVIIAEVNEIIVVKFKNMASKPFSIHAHGVSRDIPEEYMDEEEKVIWPRKEEDIAYPNETKMYIWHVTKGSAPTNKDFDCRAWTYYSDVNPERDIHSGLIGPLIVCKAGTLNKVSDMTPKVQEFSLLFLTFDENKSWYLEDNIQIFCKTPCHIRPESPTFRASNRFHTINGYVAETLPGLVMAQYRLVRWYLINMAMSAEIYSVHFHSQPFAMRRTKEHRMGVYTLFPGSFGTIEMYPTKVGYWLLDCETSVHQQAGMRAISLVYNPQCRVPLGLESGRIEDSQLTASSHEGQWAPRLARLQNTGSINAWRPTGPRPWIQVDLRTPMLVHGIITQGAKRYFKQLYVKKFYITYSLDTITWKEYKANSVMPKMVFVGNTDGTGQVKNYFNPPIVARYIRVYPRPDKNLALRMELLGCDVQSCSLPLGMEKRIIKDIQLSASSFWVSMNAWTASLARLKQQGISNAWVPKRNNPHEWLQINFLRRKKITGIITQGASRLGWSMFVKEYTISHSDDGITWTVIQDKQSTKAKVFRGNVDNNSQASNTIEPPIFAQYLRIYPQNWHRNIALRVEILGCETEQRF
eukprot:gi/632935272/ref/XP_007889515.1/ PREDICTED: coagulation factor VIII isoform X2 [Callorhinchus milii]